MGDLEADNIIGALYADRPNYPMDTSTDDTITIGEWREAIARGIDRILEQQRELYREG